LWRHLKTAKAKRGSICSNNVISEKASA